VKEIWLDIKFRSYQDLKYEAKSYRLEKPTTEPLTSHPSPLVLIVDTV